MRQVFLHSLGRQSDWDSEQLGKFLPLFCVCPPHCLPGIKTGMIDRETDLGFVVVLHSLSCARFVSLLVTHSMDGTHSPPSLPIPFSSPLVPLYHLFMGWEIYVCVERGGGGGNFCLRKLLTCRVSLPPLFLHYSLSKNCILLYPSLSILLSFFITLWSHLFAEALSEQL